MNRPHDVDDVLEQVAQLSPKESEAARPAPEALARLKRRLENAGPQSARPRWAGDGRPPSQPWRYFAMLRKRSAIAIVGALLILVAAFALPPVRAAASDFLGLFRVQKFAAISVSPRQVQLLENLADQGLTPGEITMIEEPGPRQAVDTLAEAQATTGWPVRTAGELSQPDQITVAGGGRGRLTVDVESARAILEAAEVDPDYMPKSLDGAVVDVTIYPGVEQVWAGDLTLFQTESPEVDYPEGVDTAQLGQALLQLLGMTPGEARRLAQNIDWNSTLVLPVPQDLATFSEVTVNGNSALALSGVSGDENSLMWQQDGLVFFLVGSQSVEALQQIAESVR